MKIEITDKLVERAAREQWFAETGHPNYDLWDESIDDAIDEYDGELPAWIVARKEQMRAALRAVAPIIADQALERATEANRFAREKVIHSGSIDFVRGVSAGHDRADAAIRALKEPTP